VAELSGKIIKADIAGYVGLEKGVEIESMC
jgi:hypothetical protein